MYPKLTRSINVTYSEVNYNELCTLTNAPQLTWSTTIRIYLFIDNETTRVEIVTANNKRF